jgi:hypothetical protein
VRAHGRQRRQFGRKNIGLGARYNRIACPYREEHFGKSPIERDYSSGRFGEDDFLPEVVHDLNGPGGDCDAADRQKERYT